MPPLFDNSFAPPFALFRRSRLLWEMKADDQFLRRRHVRENNAISSEEAASRKVALNVRRAALKLQVERDKQAHIDELKNKFGKTFYVDRL